METTMTPSTPRPLLKTILVATLMACVPLVSGAAYVYVHTRHQPERFSYGSACLSSILTTVSILVTLVAAVLVVLAGHYAYGIVSAQLT